MTTAGRDPFAPPLVRRLERKGLRLTPRGYDLYYRARALKRALEPVADVAMLVLTCGAFWALIVIAGASR